MPIVVELVAGRLRWWRHLVVGLLGATAAGLWFGASGLLPMLLWAWHRQPRPGRVLRLSIGPVRSARLGAFRTVAQGCGHQRLEVFHDELPAESLAALRRQLKVACSAGDRAQDVEPV